MLVVRKVVRVVVMVKVKVSRIACGVKRVRLFSERLCIYTF